MIRQTSIDTYHKIKANGLLSRARWRIYDALFQIGGSGTAAEIANAIPGHKSASVGANAHARLGELIARGCIIENGTRICSLTGETVIVYELTDNLPLGIQKTKTDKQLMREELIWMLDYLREKPKLSPQVEQWYERVRFLIGKK